jgi:hypothetical protein
MIKHCKKCGSEKPITEFPKCSSTKDGYRNGCYECEKNGSRIRQQRKSKEYKKEVSKSYKNKFPEKRRAVSATDNLPKKVGYNLHHWSYNPEHYKDVIELELAKHRKIHRFLSYDSNELKYRRKDTSELLSTKQLHLEYISQFL